MDVGEGELVFFRNVFLRGWLFFSRWFYNYGCIGSLRILEVLKNKSIWIWERKVVCMEGCGSGLKYSLYL